ncbi:MAG: peptidoglycan recognition family protein [Pseudomonadota bacterium]
MVGWTSKIGAVALTLGVCTAESALAGAGPPDIVSRDAWRAKPANTELMKPHVPREIVIHMTGVRQQRGISLERKLRGLQGFSMRKGRIRRSPKPAWGDVPYHFYIGVSGRIGEGRDLRYAGDTNTNYNPANRIHVVLEGDFQNERPSPAQLASLTRLTIWLVRRYSIQPAKITGHSDHAATTCPGKHLKAVLPSLLKAVAQ